MISNVHMTVITLCFFLIAAGCASDSHQAQGVEKGATTGAVAGAVGGMFTALIFGGNVAEAGARGAVYGGASGAVVGGMAGAEVDRAEEAERLAKREAEIEEFRKSVGPDAFNGVVALTECKHAVAIANAREAAKSGNNDFVLAGVWLEVLSEADRNNEPGARALFPDLVRLDEKVNSDSDAEASMQKALQELGEIRIEYDRPADCPA
jgi:hypothetical protein